MTTIKGYNANNEVVATKVTAYNDRYDAINEIMNMPNVEYIRTETVLRV